MGGVGIDVFEDLGADASYYSHEHREESISLKPCLVKALEFLDCGSINSALQMCRESLSNCFSKIMHAECSELPLLPTFKSPDPISPCRSIGLFGPHLSLSLAGRLNLQRSICGPQHTFSQHVVLCERARLIYLVKVWS